MASPFPGEFRLLRNHMTAYEWDASDDLLAANLLAWIERTAEGDG